MAEGTRLGIDWGKARIGVAASARGTSFAFPVETVAANGSEFDRLVTLITDYEPKIVYVGLPLTLAGDQALAADYVLEQVRRLVELMPGLAVRLIDERMSTSGPSRSLTRAGRTARQQRKVIDQAAAVEILQRALDFEASGTPAGVAFGEEEQ